MKEQYELVPISETKSDFETLKEISYDANITAITSTQDGRKLIVTDSLGNVTTFVYGQMSKLSVVGKHGDGVNSLNVSKDGKYFVTGSIDSTVKLWNAIEGNEVQTFKGHTESVTSVAISSDNQFIVSGSLDKTIRIWSITDLKNVKIIKIHKEAITGIAITQNNQFIYSTALDNTIKVTKVENPKTEFISWNTSVSSARNLILDPNSQYFIVSIDDAVNIYQKISLSLTDRKPTSPRNRTFSQLQVSTNKQQNEKSIDEKEVPVTDVSSPGKENNNSSLKIEITHPIISQPPPPTSQPPPPTSQPPPPTSQPNTTKNDK